jgi:ankyrin repeat protein
LINQKVIDDFNPLIIASQQGHLQVVKILLDRGVNPKLTTAYGSTALHLASQKGHLDVVKALVEKDPTLVDQRTMNGFTCINLAENHGCSEVAKFLKKFQPGLDDRSSQGEKTHKPSEEKISDPWELCKKGRFEDLKSLIEADRSILFDHKYSKATMAAGVGSSEKTLFHLLAENGSDKAIGILGENSVPAHFKLTCTIKYRFQQKIAGDAEGITPLYLAVQKGRKAMVEFLITESDVDCIVRKNSEDGDQKKYSLLEGAVKEANLKGGDSFEILKIITGDNPNGKKANFYSSGLTEDEKQNQKERIARRFQSYREEVKVLLRKKYPTEIAEIEKMSDEKRGPEPSPRVGGASQSEASIGNEGFYV